MLHHREYNYKYTLIIMTLEKNVLREESGCTKIWNLEAKDNWLLNIAVKKYVNCPCFAYFTQ